MQARPCRIIRTVLAALLVATVAVPFAKPLACDATGHATTPMHDAHGGNGIAWSDAGDQGPCHDAAECGVALIAPVLEPVCSVTTLPSHRERAPSPIFHTIPIHSAAVTPPPRA